MKNALLVSTLLCCLLVKAQGPQQLVDVPYDSWPGANVKGWLYLPADYATSTKNYPVVFFYHGVGEAGTNPYTLLNQGLPNLIAGGMRPDNIINPDDGQPYSFIVLSVQHWSWSPGANWLPYELKWLKENYRVDTNRVYVTGLSAGGQSSFATTVNDNNVSKLIAAAVPMSPAPVAGYDPTLIAQNKIKTWFFSGNVDGSYTANATGYSSDCNVQYPGSSTLNIFSGGHCCWNTFYNTSWKDATTSQSIWQWMLRSTRVSTSLPLPVNFIKVRLSPGEAGVTVKWDVAEELNVDHYEVEKSIDAKSFYTVARVAAKNSPAYSFDDSQPKKYYRVKSVDKDGKVKYSNVATNTAATSDITLKAFPMPVSNSLTLQHPIADIRSRIVVQSSDARVVMTVSPMAGTFQTRFDLTSQKPGLYIIRYENGDGQVSTLKIAKQ